MTKNTATLTPIHQVAYTHQETETWIHVANKSHCSGAAKTLRCL